MIEIPEGDYYDCKDSERLSFESPEEAIEEYLECSITKDCDVSALIREGSPIELTVYAQGAVSETWIQAEARQLVEHVEVSFGDEYGNPDESDWSKQALEKCRPAFVSAIREMLAETSVWQCERIATVQLPPEQVEAMMREHRPDWFEEPE